MGFFSSEMEPMIDIYQRETVELLDEWDQKLLTCVKRESLSQNDIKALFRVVHTIKSSSAMMGMEDLSVCSHHLEELFLLFQQHPERAAAQEMRLLDTLYAYAEFAIAEINKVADENYQPASGAGLLKILDKELKYFQYVTDTSPAEKPALPQDVDAAQENKADSGQKPQISISAVQSTPESKEIYAKSLRIFFHKDCQMENARAFMIIKQIKPFCTVLSSVPENLDEKSAAESIRKDGLVVNFQTASPDSVVKKILSSPYVEKIEDKNEKKDTPQAIPDEIHDSARANRFITIPWERLSELHEILSDMTQINAQLQTAHEKNMVMGDMEEILHRNSKALSEMEKIIHEASLMPISSIIPQYYHIVRDIAKEEGKEVALKVVGDELLADRSTLDAIAKPLIHLIRNAIDHGIEAPEVRLAAGKSRAGSILLSIENLGGSLSFSVSDDGQGIRPSLILKRAEEKNLLTKPAALYTQEEIANLIFLPGFSTTSQATRYSGRGVGMDVVQHTVDTLGGITRLESQEGRGTRFIMEVPAAVTSQECICFYVGKFSCLLPIRTVERIYGDDSISDKLKHINGKLFFQENSVIPVLDLHEAFQDFTTTDHRLIVIQTRTLRFAILVNKISGRLTAVEKTLPKIFNQTYRLHYGISGCAVTGEGTLGLILNPDWLVGMLQKKGTGDKSE